MTSIFWFDLSNNNGIQKKSRSVLGGLGGSGGLVQGILGNDRVSGEMTGILGNGDYQGISSLGTRFRCLLVRM